MDLSIVIPCYNEVESVPKIEQELFPVLVELTKTQEVELLFVDDGSSDGTGQALIDAFGNGSHWGFSIRVERHKINQGLGAAIRTGFAASRGAVVVTTDSDGTYKFSEIPALLAYLTPDVDIVTASPYHPNGGVMNVPGYRLILSRGASAVYRLLGNRRIHTYTALFRAYRRHIIQQIPFESNDFLAGTELLVNAMRMGYRVAEYPTVLHSRVVGESKAKLARTVRSHLNFQLSALQPWFPYGTVIKGKEDTVYLYDQRHKRMFPSAEIFLSHGYHWEQIAQVDENFLTSTPDGPPMSFRDGSLIKGSDETVYVIEHGRKRPIPSVAIFEGLGYRWKNIIVVPDKILASTDTGEILTSTDKHPDGTLVKSAGEAAFLLEAGAKRLFPTVQVFVSWGYKWQQIITITESELASYPLGQPMIPQEKFYLEEQRDSFALKKSNSPQKKILSYFLQLGIVNLVLVNSLCPIL